MPELFISTAAITNDVELARVYIETLFPIKNRVEIERFRDIANPHVQPTADAKPNPVVEYLTGLLD